MNAQQLKNSILQMAVQGKLVPQNPNDEPANVLLERIRKEKEQLIKEKKIKKEKNPSYIFRGTDNLPYEKVGNQEPVCIADEVPFEIPDSWEWVRLGTIFQINPRNKLPDELDTGFISMTLLSSGYGSSHRFEPRKWKNIKNGFTHFANNDIVIAKITPCFQNRKSAIIEGLPNGFGAGTTELHVLHAPTKELFMPYFLLICKTQQFIQDGIKNFSGTAGQQRIGKDFVSKYLVPVPPIEEQKRIIEKINLLEPLLSKFEDIYNSIVKQQQDFPLKLKKSMLQWAIQGKLITQNALDEPASRLLNRIHKEKKQLVKEQRRKKDKYESIIFRRDNSYYEKLDGKERCIDDEIPFEIPDSWEWVRLANICEYIQRGKSPKYSEIRKYPVIAQKCNQWSGFSIDKAKFIDPNSLKSYTPERILQNNDLMWNSTGLGTLGRMAIYKDVLNPYELAVADSHVTVIRPLKKWILSDYLYCYFANPTVQNAIEKQSDGTTKQKELATATIKSYLVPIPPYEEQKRIVECIDKILPLISKL